MAKKIIIKPIISEKSDLLMDKLNQYSFVVSKDANKLEIKKAVENMFSVNVESVNTAVMPGKAKVRNTRNGIMRGKVSSYKKAIVKLSEGESIDFFGDV